MDVDTSPFDLGELSSRIAQKRAERGLAMVALAREVGVSAPTIRRFRTADDVEADGVLASTTPPYLTPRFTWSVVVRTIVIIESVGLVQRTGGTKTPHGKRHLEAFTDEPSPARC